MRPSVLDRCERIRWQKTGFWLIGADFERIDRRSRRERRSA
jgi:hypothetical protein